MKVFKIVLFVLLCILCLGLIVNLINPNADTPTTDDPEPVTEITLDPTEIVF